MGEELIRPEGEAENPWMPSPVSFSRPCESGDKSLGALMTTRASPNQPTRQSRRHSSFSSASRPHHGSLRRAQQHGWSFAVQLRSFR